MPDLFTITAPLLIRLPNGGPERVMVERYRHPRGILYFEPFWNLEPEESRIHLAEGTIKGDGPWKVGDHVVQVLGCHGAHGEHASDHEAWRQYLIENGEQYPSRAEIDAIARRHGADV